MGGYLDLRRRQKLSMEGLRGDGGEGQLGGRKKPLRGWVLKTISVKIDFQCDHYFIVYFGTTFTFIDW